MKLTKNQKVIGVIAVVAVVGIVYYRRNKKSATTNFTGRNDEYSNLTGFDHFVDYWRRKITGRGNTNNP